MSAEERLQAIELLWDSLSAVPEQIESPEWHEEVLAKRLAKADSGQANFLTFTQVKERLGR